MRIEQALAEEAFDLRFLRKRREVAHGDLNFYSHLIEKQEKHLAKIVESKNGLWLTLMNSGISHRRFLQTVQRAEARS